MKKIFNIFLIVFLISFQLKSFAGEKNYHKELITDWSRIFPDKNRNAAGPKFFKYIIDKKITYKDFIEFNKLYCAVSGSLIDPESDSEFLFVKESKTKNKSMGAGDLTSLNNALDKIKKTGTVTSVTQRLLDSIERRLTNRNKKKK